MEENNVVQSNNKNGVYLVIIMLMGLVILGGFWFWYSQNQLTKDEMFVANAIIDYEKYYKKDGKKAEFDIKEIRLYKSVEGYNKLVIFRYDLKTDYIGNFNNQKFGYVELKDGKTENLGDLISDNKLLGSMINLYWDDMDYETINLKKIQNYIEKKI